MGSAQIIRYLARHGGYRVARVALVSTTAPFLLNTEDNPDGMGEDLLDEMVAALHNDRAQWAAAIANPWFGNGLPGVSISTDVHYREHEAPGAGAWSLRGSVAWYLRNAHRSRKR